MPEINIIPDRILPALVALAELPQAEVDDLLEALKTTSPVMWAKQLPSQAVTNLKIMEPAKAQPIVDALISLYIARNEFSLNAEDATTQILGASKETEGAAFSEEQKQVLSPLLLQSLSFDKSLGVTAKAIDVFMQHEHVFCNARMMTDIRPIFQDEPSAKPSAAAIVHTLKIGYHLGREYKEFFVALDNEDVKILQNVLDRETVKTSSLHTVLDKASIVLLEA